MKSPSLFIGAALVSATLIGGALVDQAGAADNGSKYQVRSTDSGEAKGKWASDAAFVVIGSFQTETRAQRLIAERSDWGCKILKAEVEGRTQYRVVFGPFPKEVVKSAVSRATKAGISDAWLLPTDSSGVQAKADSSATAG